jgi:hypothetical protein
MAVVLNDVLIARSYRGKGLAIRPSWQDNVENANKGEDGLASAPTDTLLLLGSVVDMFTVVGAE